MKNLFTLLLITFASLLHAQTPALQNPLPFQPQGRNFSVENSFSVEDTTQLQGPVYMPGVLEFNSGSILGILLFDSNALVWFVGFGALKEAILEEILLPQGHPNALLYYTNESVLTTGDGMTLVFNDSLGFLEFKPENKFILNTRLVEFYIDSFLINNYYMPIADGGPGQFITTDGSGNLSFSYTPNSLWDSTSVVIHPSDTFLPVSIGSNKQLGGSGTILSVKGATRMNGDYENVTYFPLNGDTIGFTYLANHFSNEKIIMGAGMTDSTNFPISFLQTQIITTPRDISISANRYITIPVLPTDSTGIPQYSLWLDGDIVKRKP